MRRLIYGNDKSDVAINSTMKQQISKIIILTQPMLVVE